MNKNIGKFGIGGKRKRTPTSEDPYMPAEGHKEPAICESCQALYRNKRWYLDPDEAKKALNDSSVNRVTCPACRKIAEHYPEGIVTLSGSYLWNHEEEIRNILRNEESKAVSKNPLERIMSIKREGDDLVIETTEEKLAEHLGRALHSAHQGELSVDWTEDHNICRVQWRRG